MPKFDRSVFVNLHKVNFFLVVYPETIGVSQIIIWWLIFEKQSFHFWREIWIWVVVILLQLYLYEKLHFNFNTPSIQRDIFNFVMLGIMAYWKIRGKSNFEKLLEKKTSLNAICKQNGLIFYCLSTTNDKVLKMSINQRRAQNASIYDGSSS